MRKFPAQAGAIPPIVLIIGAVLLIGAVLVSTGTLKISVDKSKSGSSSSQSSESNNKTVSEDQKEIKDVPKGVNQILTAKDIKKIESTGVKIYTGETPPPISGTYAANSLILSYDTPGWEGAIPVGTKVNSVYTYEIESQDSSGLISLKYGNSKKSDTAGGSGAYISGKDNCFSIFIDASGQAGQCSYSAATILSGCKVSSGFSDFTHDLLVKSKKGADCHNYLPSGYQRVFKESDNLVEKI